MGQLAKDSQVAQQTESGKPSPLDALTPPSPDGTETATAVRQQEAPVERWLCERPSKKVEQTVERLSHSDDVRHIALMPDLHQGKAVPNGLVMATQNLVYPEAIGSDIGCGVTVLGFEADATFIQHGQRIGEIQSALLSLVPTLKHSSENRRDSLPVSLLQEELSDPALQKMTGRDGLYQLGSLGRGNHFIEFQADTDGKLWIMVHSGSRGMGQAIFEHHMRGTEKSSSGLGFLEIDSPEGANYIQDMEWAVRYASFSRMEMLLRTATFLQQEYGLAPDQQSLIDSPHNFGRMEEHFGEAHFVHRKSALSAQEGEIGLIPGSMGTKSFIVEGRGNPDSLCSSSHGAGRPFSRREAFEQIGTRDFKRRMAGIAFNEDIAAKLRDESPDAYRDIEEVMRAQRDLTKRVAELHPILSEKRV